ncbi:MAG TPA: rhodanese-like domain-containing protein [Candidatus Binatia bacterium]|nr:rhodanese-like domain-containing protein [Candidatus Binatia bacterium]
MIRELSPEQAAQILRLRPDAVYLDVRTEAEFSAGHPAGAYNIPVMFFDAAHRPVANADFTRVVQAALSPETSVLVGCQSGVRSQHAAEILCSLGFADVSNVAGGFGGSRAARGWRDSGLPVESGHPAGRAYDDLKKPR